ncbi:MAG: DUF1501 domain-containing protein [Planctomycetaceae bacterium]|nr:DUF1501 domain-containing protein [Planctomycetaceae bacterium]
MVQAGTVGILGLGMNHLEQLRAETANPQSHKSVIYIFLSGGLGQQDSFDLKPNAPVEIRGEFNPISTKTPGVQICEHMPMLAQRSDKWSMVRSLTHPHNEHSAAHMVMLCGKSDLPVGFNPSMPRPTDHPSLAAITGQMLPMQNNLPPAIILPEKMIHRSGRVIPGQMAGSMGTQHDPFFLKASPFNSQTYGAWPEYGFHHARGAENSKNLQFQAPNLSIPEGMQISRVKARMELLHQIDSQQKQLRQLQELDNFDRYQKRAISMLMDEKMKDIFNVTQAEGKSLDRYGRNVFGWSLLLARRLVEAGVSLVQVNLGNNETWDTHGNAFPHLKNHLFPPMDRSVSALLDDLDERGLLDDTLIVMAGEFGRTPKISLLPSAYELPGRDHWGKLQTVFLAGGGIQGGRVIGASDKIGGEPISDPQTPENLAATIYQSLGLPKTANWSDLLDRPIPVYNGNPIAGLT